MGFFKSRNNLNELEGHNNDLFTDEDDILLDDSFFSLRKKNKSAAPHAITADEIVGNEGVETIPMESERPVADSVYEKLKAKTLEQAAAIDDDYVPSWAVSTEKPIEIDTYSNTETVVEATADTQDEEPYDDFLAKCKMAVDLATTGVHYDEKAFEVFASDDYEKPLDVAEAASAVDVEDIIRRLKSEHNLPEVEPEPEELEVSDEEVVLEEKPITTDEVVDPATEVILNTYTAPSESVIDTEEIIAVHEDVMPEVPVEEIPMVLEEAGIDAELFRADDEKITIQTADDVVVEVDAAADVEEEPAGEVKLQVEIIPTDSDSDIMHTDMGGAIEAAEDLERTVVFGGVSGLADLSMKISQKAEMDLDALAELDEIDEEDNEFDELSYYETEDKDLAGIDDYKDLNDAARLRTQLMQTVATGTAFTALSFATTALIVLVSMLSGLFGASAAGVITLLLLVATVCFNYGIFADLKNLPELKIGFDSCVAVATSVALVQSVVSAFFFNGAYSAVAGAAAFLMAANSLFQLLRTKRILSGLELIANSEVKNAVTAAGGTPAANIASGAVEGESIVLSGRRVVNIKNYLKNCGYKSPFDLKAKVLLFAGLAAATVVGLVAGILSGVGYGLSLAALVLCAACPACAVMTAEMPMQFTAKKLKGYGAMLAGFKGAYNLNMANVIGVKTSDLFPEGTVTLYDMKPLSENEVGHSLMNAAAVAIAANSPLAPIFKNIIGEDCELPEVTGVQYEDKMGITGWIGDLTILIGNRNLMQGHNVSVPPASVDQKILRGGYFPVYIACDGVPCLLFIVKYEPDKNVVHELRRVCDTGMTVVVYPEDPNPSDMMLCDYFGLTNDAIKVMRHNGRIAYEKATAEAESTSAPASYGKSICGLFAAVTNSINLKATMSVLTVLYVIAAVLGVVTLLYMSVVGKLYLVTSLVFIVFQGLFMGLAACVSRMVNR